MSVYHDVETRLLRAAPSEFERIKRQTGFSRHYLWRVKMGKLKPSPDRLGRLMDVMDAKQK